MAKSTPKDVVAVRPSTPLTVALIIALGTGVWLLKGYFSLIITAMIFSYLFRPMYLWFLKKTNKDSTAAALTLVTSILVIAIPLILVLIATILQATSIISHLSTTFSTHELNRLANEAIKWFNDTLSHITYGTVTITAQQLLAHLSSLASEVANFVLNTIKSWVGSIGSTISGAILYMYVFTGLLVHHDKLVTLFKRLNPLGAEVTDLYLEKAGGMTKAMVKGQFIIAIIQGVVSAIGLSIAGLPYFAFFLLLLTFMSIIPLGAGIVTIPIGIVNIALGNYWQGALIILNHLVIVTNIDNVLKPKLVPKSVRLHPALLLISIFAGLGAVGFLGIIVGPVIMILIITTINVYLKVTDKNPSNAQ